MHSFAVRSCLRPHPFALSAGFGVLLTWLAGCGDLPASVDGGGLSRPDAGTVDAAPAGDGGVRLDFGSLPDLGIPGDLDTDGDGLCDVREILRGSNVAEADTDGDELPDYDEFFLGTDPLDPSSPALGDLLFLAESVGVGTSAGLRQRVVGVGADYSGAFVALPASDLEGQSAETFYVRSFATSATPMGNVAMVAPELERYSGVVGSTELGFEVEFAVPPGFLARGCGRVYPLRYDVKGSDGRAVGTFRRYLVVLPAAGSFADGPWCIPVRCI